MEKIQECIDCNKPAKYIRHTHIAGSNYFCEEHAKAQPDFLIDDNNKYWSEIKEQPKYILEGVLQYAEIKNKNGPNRNYKLEDCLSMVEDVIQPDLTKFKKLLKNKNGKK